MIDLTTNIALHETHPEPQRVQRIPLAPELPGLRTPPNHDRNPQGFAALVLAERNAVVFGQFNQAHAQFF